MIKPKIILGRGGNGVECDLMLSTDTAVSRRHFTIRFAPEHQAMEIENLSKNGILINGEFIRHAHNPVLLTSQAEIAYGKSDDMRVTLLFPTLSRTQLKKEPQAAFVPLIQWIAEALVMDKELTPRSIVEKLRAAHSNDLQNIDDYALFNSVRHVLTQNDHIFYVVASENDVLNKYLRDYKPSAGELDHADSQVGQHDDDFQVDRDDKDPKVDRGNEYPKLGKLDRGARVGENDKGIQVGYYDENVEISKDDKGTRAEENYKGAQSDVDISDAPVDIDTSVIEADEDGMDVQNDNAAKDSNRKVDSSAKNNRTAKVNVNSSGDNVAKGDRDVKFDRLGTSEKHGKDDSVGNDDMDVECSNDVKDDKDKIGIKSSNVDNGENGNDNRSAVSKDDGDGNGDGDIDMDDDGGPSESSLDQGSLPRLKSDEEIAIEPVAKYAIRAEERDRFVQLAQAAHVLNAFSNNV